MNIREVLELIQETRAVLIDDYKSTHSEEPTNSELLQHVKSIIKEGNADCLLEEVLLEEDIENPEELFRLLLLTAATVVEDLESI